METPTIHLNGSSRESLLEQNEAARTALRHAMEALGEAYPNARDYYPKGPDAAARAAKEHAARLERLQSVYRELGELAEHIADA